MQAIAFAVPDNIQTGQYNVSFDLGFPKNSYTAKADSPAATESLDGKSQTVYGITITDKMDSHKTIIIVMTEYSEIQQGASAYPELMKAALRKTMPGATEYAIREIDGKTGAIARYSVSGQTFCIALYYPNDYLVAVLIPTYPWDEGTLSLLKTLHIEKINPAAKPVQKNNESIDDLLK